MVLKDPESIDSSSAYYWNDSIVNSSDRSEAERQQEIYYILCWVSLIYGEPCWCSNTLFTNWFLIRIFSLQKLGTGILFYNLFSSFLSREQNVGNIDIKLQWFWSGFCCKSQMAMVKHTLLYNYFFGCIFNMMCPIIAVTQLWQV